MKENVKSQIIVTSNLNDLMFNVEKVETGLITGLDANSDYNHMILVGDAPNKKIVNACSDRYELVPISTFAPQIRQIISDKGVNFEEKYTMINHSVFYGEIIIKDNSFYIGDNKEDTLYMRVWWSHSYNGKEQYELNMGTFRRYLCTNGLWITGFDTQQNGLAIKGRHTVKIQSSLAQLKNKLEYILSDEVKEIAKKVYQPLYDHWVKDYDKRLEEVLKVAGIGATKPNLEEINKTIIEESNDLYGGKVNDWLIYNAVNKFMFDYDNNVALETTRRAKDNKVLERLLTTI